MTGCAHFGSVQSVGPVLLVAVLFALLGLACFRLGSVALDRGRLGGVALSLVAAVVALALAGLCVTVAIGTRGYRSFVGEVVVAVVTIMPTGPHSMSASFELPDGRETTLSLAGDQLQLDAQILRWKPVAGVLGLTAAYELGRVGSRYAGGGNELSRPAVPVSLARRKPVDMYDLRRRFPWFGPLLDVRLATVALAPGEAPAAFELRLDTTRFYAVAR